MELNFHRELCFTFEYFLNNESIPFLGQGLCSSPAYNPRDPISFSQVINPEDLKKKKSLLHEESYSFISKSSFPNFQSTDIFPWNISNTIEGQNKKIF